MPIQIVPFNKRRQSIASSEEDGQIRTLSTNATMSNKLKEELAKHFPNSAETENCDQGEVEAGVIPGVPDGTGPRGGTPACPLSVDEDLPVGRGGGRGRAVPGVPGTGPRGGTSLCPLSDEDNTEIITEEITEELEPTEVFDDVSNEKNEEINVEIIPIEEVSDDMEDTEGLGNIIDKLLDALSNLLEEGEEDREGVLDVIVEDGVNDDKIPGIPDGTGPGKDSPECPFNQEDDTEEAEDELTKRSKSGIPPWQYKILEDYFKDTEDPSLEDINEKMDSNLGEVTIDNFMEAKKIFLGEDPKDIENTESSEDVEDSEDSGELEEIQFVHDVKDKENKTSARSKYQSFFPELLDYRVV